MEFARADDSVVAPADGPTGSPAACVLLPFTDWFLYDLHVNHQSLGGPDIQPLSELSESVEFYDVALYDLVRSLLEWIGNASDNKVDKLIHAPPRIFFATVGDVLDFGNAPWSSNPDCVVLTRMESVWWLLRYRGKLMMLSVALSCCMSLCMQRSHAPANGAVWPSKNGRRISFSTDGSLRMVSIGLWTGCKSAYYLAVRIRRNNHFLHWLPVAIGAIQTMDVVHGHHVIH